jgi:3',5'-cyclic-nucleotide phosphodiesterase
MQTGSSIEIDGRKITSHAVNHTVGSVAYRLVGQKEGFVFTGDMSSTPELWLALLDEKNISKVIVDCSFTNADYDLAERSKHFCPRSLIKDISEMPDAVEFLIYHLKPGQEEQIMKELHAASGKRVITALNCGDQFQF